MYLGGMLAGVDNNSSSFAIISTHLMISEVDNHQDMEKGDETNVSAALVAFRDRYYRLLLRRLCVFIHTINFPLSEHQIIFHLLSMFLGPEC
jgi:hypothetical protein